MGKNGQGSLPAESTSSGCCQKAATRKNRIFQFLCHRNLQIGTKKAARRQPETRDAEFTVLATRAVPEFRPL